MLSYRSETALQGALVLAKSGRLKLGDNILRTSGLSSTIVTKLAGKATEFGEKLQNKDYYAYLVPFRSYRSLGLLFKFLTLCVFEPLFGGGLGTTYDVHLGLIGSA